MLRELGKATALALLVAALLASGCVDEEEFTRARLECIDLTSQAFARIPDCETQQECFGKLEGALFNFSDKELDYGVRQELFEYKNHIARSWLYYNRALERVESIRSVCLAGKGFERLPLLSSELNHFLLMSFEESDKANVHSLSVLALEASGLERDEVGKIPEEQLFDVYVKINSNLDELSLRKHPSGTKGYYSKVLKKVEEFNLLSAETGLYSIVLKQFGIEDILLPLYGGVGQGFVKKYKEKAFFLPLLGQAFSGFISFLGESHDLQRSLELLRKSPAFEFLNIYSDFAGERDSVLAEFAALVKEDTLSRRFVELENTGLEGSIGEKIALAREKIEKAQLEEFSYLDENFFFSLYSLLSEETPFSYREFDFESVREGWLGSGQELERIEFEFHSILSRKHTNTISLGEKTSALKRISLSIGELIESLEYIEGELLSGIVEKCNERVPLIEPRLKGLGESNSQEWFFHSRALIEERADSFAKAGELSEKIHYCYESLAGLDGLLAALNDEEAREKAVRMEIGDCLDSLDIFLPFLEDSDKELFESIERFKESMDFATSKQESSTACFSLLSLAEGSVRRALGAQATEKDFSESLGLLEKLGLLLEKAPALRKSSSSQELEKEATELSAYFKDGKISLSKGVGSIHSIKWRVSELRRKLEKEIETLLSQYISERLVFKSFPVSEAALGKEFEDRKRIEFLNPFFPWERPLSISFPFKQEFGGIRLKSENVLEFMVKNSTATAQFSNLPEGLSFVEVFSSLEIAFSEKEKLVQLNEQYAEIEKEITIHSSVPVSRVRAEIPLNTGGLGVSRLRAFAGSKGLPVFLQGGKAVFFIESLEPESKLYLYYALLEPLELEKSLISTTRIDENRSEMEFSFSVTNRLAFEVKNVRVGFAFPYREEYVERIEFFDGQGIERNVSIISGGLGFEVSLGPGQKKEFLARLRIADERAFMKGLLEEAREKLERLSGSEDQQVSAESRKLLGELGGLGGMEFQENWEKASKLFDLAVALEKRTELNSELEKELLFYEKELEQKISSLKKEQQAAESLGFEEYSAGISGLLSESERKLAEARKAGNSDKQKALELLGEAMVALNSFSQLDLFGELRSLAEAHFSEISGIFGEWHSLGFAQGSTSSQRARALGLLEEFERAAEKAEFAKAKESVDSLESLSQDTKADLERKIDARAGEIVDKINEFLEAYFSVGGKLAELKSELGSISEEEIVKARLVLPVSLAEAEKIGRELEGEHSSHRRLFDRLLGLWSAGKKKELVLEAQGINFQELIGSIAELESLIDAMNKSIQAEALSSLSEAKERLNFLDEEGILALEDSVNEARKNNYLKSLVLSRAALTSLKESQELDWAYLLFPAFIILIFLFSRAYKKTRHSHTPFYRKVPRQF